MLGRVQLLCLAPLTPLWKTFLHPNPHPSQPRPLAPPICVLVLFAYLSHLGSCKVPQARFHSSLNHYKPGFFWGLGVQLRTKSTASTPSPGDIIQQAPQGFFASVHSSHILHLETQITSLPCLKSSNGFRHVSNRICAPFQASEAHPESLWQLSALTSSPLFPRPPNLFLLQAFPLPLPGMFFPRLTGLTSSFSSPEHSMYVTPLTSWCDSPILVSFSSEHLSWPILLLLE